MVTVQSYCPSSFFNVIQVPSAPHIIHVFLNLQIHKSSFRFFHLSAKKIKKNPYKISSRGWVIISMLIMLNYKSLLQASQQCLADPALGLKAMGPPWWRTAFNATLTRENGSGFGGLPGPSDFLSLSLNGLPCLRQIWCTIWGFLWIHISCSRSKWQLWPGDFTQLRSPYRQQQHTVVCQLYLFLDQAALHTVSHALVSSWLDYCNLLYMNTCHGK